MINIAKPYVGKEEAQAAYNTIMSGWITQGPKVSEFELKFAKYVGSKYAVAVSNCTTALQLSLIVGGVKINDEVICPSLSYIATTNCIKHIYAKPVLAEIDPNTYNLDIDDVKSKITNKTKAIILVHQMGVPANIEDFKNICSKHNILLVEDAACAIGSSYNKKKIGSHSDLVCFSFHPRKIISTGDGGMITTSNKKWYDRLRLLRQHGMSINDRVRHESKKVVKEKYLEVGYNFRMTDIQASVGIEQLKKLDFIVKERRKIAQKYNIAFSKCKNIRILKESDISFFNYQSYPIYLKKSCPIKRDILMQKLLDMGIATRRGIMTSHTEPAYKLEKIVLPLSEDASKNSIIIPLYVPMDNKEINYVIESFLSLVCD